MIKLLTSESARLCDRRQIEKGTSSLLLMQRAAEGLFDFISGKNFKKAAIICGKGNNGGDGYALAAIMQEKGLDPTLFCTEGELTGDAEYYSRKYTGRRMPLSGNENFGGFDVIVDALLGTGVNKPVTGLYKAVIESINASGIFVLACDLPSGLNATNGRIQGLAVKADATVTFAAMKTGLVLADGPDCCGKTIVWDIGVETENCDAYLAEEKDVASCFRPLKSNTHKGTNKRTGIIGGSKNFAGAPLLSLMGESALRTGAGLAGIGFPDFLYDAFAVRALHTMLYPQKSNDGVIAFDEKQLDYFTSCDAVALGMGMGKCADIDKILRFICRKENVKVVLDADGLNNVSGRAIKELGARLVLTPHVKEFARLAGKEVETVLNNPVEEAKNFAAESGAVVMLKSNTTVVTDGDKVILCNFGTPAMATGGSGDLLSGVTAGLLARTGDRLNSAVAACAVTGTAAKIALKEFSEFSLLPADTSLYIAKAVKLLLRAEKAQRY